MINPIFNPHLSRWQARPDGDPFETLTSHLLPVQWRKQPAMLKVFKDNSDETATVRICLCRIVRSQDDGVGDPALRLRSADILEDILQEGV